MFKSAVRFLAALVATFVLLTYMWVSAASAQTLEQSGRAACTLLPSGVVACEGSALPSAPRGTVKHRPAVSAAHRAQAALAAYRLAHVGGRVGTTVIIARLGAR